MFATRRRLGLLYSLSMHLRLGPRVVVICVVCVACRPSFSADPGTAPRTTVTPDETGHTGDTAVVTDTEYGVFDCATIEREITEVVPVQGAHGFNGLAIGDDGMLVGSDGWSLWKVDRDGEGGVFTPNVGTVYQMVYLPDGDLVVASGSQGALLRVAPNGAHEPLVDLPNVYGLTLGPDGMIYACKPDGVYRVDPDTGESQRWVRADGFTARVIDFDRDLGRAFIGSIDGQGRVYVVELDEDFNPVTEPQIMVAGVGGWHDGLVVDACGNIYVADYNRNNLSRITRDLEVHVAYDYNYSEYGHGILWGTGQDGWDELSFYVPQPYNGNKVLQLRVGVPSRTWPGTVIND